MIRLIKKKAKSIVCSVLAAVTLFTMNPAVFATETATQTDTVSSVDVSGSGSSDATDKSTQTVLQTVQRQPAVRQTTR